MQSETTPSTPPDRPPQTVFCLLIDLVGSTAQGLAHNTWQADKFNLALVDQITPHLTALDLHHAFARPSSDRCPPDRGPPPEF